MYHTYLGWLDGWARWVSRHRGNRGHAFNRRSWWGSFVNIASPSPCVKKAGTHRIMEPLKRNWPWLLGHKQGRLPWVDLFPGRSTSPPLSWGGFWDPSLKLSSGGAHALTGLLCGSLFVFLPWQYCNIFASSTMHWSKCLLYFILHLLCFSRGLSDHVVHHTSKAWSLVSLGWTWPHTMKCAFTSLS